MMMMMRLNRRAHYEHLPSEEQEHRLEEKRTFRQKALSYGVVFVGLTTMLFISTRETTVLRGSFRQATAPVVQHHKEVIPTLLSVVDPETNDYLYALDNPLYERLRQANFWWHFPPHVHVVEEPQLHVDRTVLSVRDPLTVSWTPGRDASGKPIVTDDDVLVLHCGQSDSDLHTRNLQERNILEAATLAQAGATSRKHGGTNENEWYFPRFHVLRQEVCQFQLYKVHYPDDYHVLATSEPFKIRFVTTPTAIHLALGSDPTEIVINFVTGGTGTPVAMYGPDEPSTKVTGTSDTYAATDLCHAPANQTEPGKFQSPGQLHTVRVTDLKANTIYQYKVGLAHGQGVTWSDTYRFTSAPTMGDSPPWSFVAYGDQGCPSQGWGYGSQYTSSWTKREVEDAQHPARMVHHFGDLSYAQGAAHQWDEWLDMIQPFTTRVPLMIAVGNHEYDHVEGGGNGRDPSGVKSPDGFRPIWGNFHNDSGGECGVPTAKRFTMPQSDSSNGVFWYSFDYANVHTTVISSEHDLSPGSRQHDWLEDDLASVNRTVTPWLVVESHRPLYEAEASWENNAVGIAMRYEFEDLLKDYNVDLVLAGHYHAYHRSCAGLYRSKCNNGGPTHITVGSAGAHLDELPLFRTGWTARFIPQEYGYGRITVMNASALHFEFVKAGDENDTSAGQVHDDVWITR